MRQIDNNSIYLQIIFKIHHNFSLNLLLTLLIKNKLNCILIYLHLRKKEISHSNNKNMKMLHLNI